MKAGSDALQHPIWKAPDWRPLAEWSSTELPSDVRAWLLDPGSLTERLVQASDNQFAVQVLSQGWHRPRRPEQQLLGLPHTQIALIREVALLCAGEPWVYARSVIPVESLNGPLRHLRKLADDSLGAKLFSDPSMTREPFQVARFPRELLPLEVPEADTIWGRRSKFTLQGKPLLVSEIFLPSFRPWTEGTKR